MTRLRRFRRRDLGGFFFPAVLVLATAGLSGHVRADDVFQALDQEVSALFEKAKPSVVQVQSGDGDVTLSGTGFFIDDKGTVLTSASIIGANTSARVSVNGGEFQSARVVGNDLRSGLAELQVADQDSPALPLGESTDMKTGYTVIAVGFPLGADASPTVGLITGFDIRYINQFFATTHIHAAVPISPGQVGGPLLNRKGEVVGMVVPSPDDGRSAYALPVEAINKILADFSQYGRAKHGWVGVDVVEVADKDHDGRCVQVVRTVPGTPASQSGILPGDIVMRIDSREVYRPADVMDASFFSHVGGSMTVVVRRNETLYNYTFAVIERPTPPGLAAPAAGPKTTQQSGVFAEPVFATR
jgi:S1-C subfamily serine protease